MGDTEQIPKVEVHDKRVWFGFSAQMIWTAIYRVLTIIALLWIGIGKPFTPSKDAPKEENRKAIDTLSAAVASLKSDVAILNTDVAVLHQQMTDMKEMQALHGYHGSSGLVVTNNVY